MSDAEEFENSCKKNIVAMSQDPDFQGLSNVWLRESIRHGYGMNFSWFGRPIIQYPTDIYAIQEMIWAVKPDLLIETGIARGGSLIMSASLLAMLDYADAVAAGETLDPAKPKRRVLGIDIDIRSHNRAAIEAHPMAGLITMIQGSSIDPGTIDQVKQIASGYKRVLVFLDSNHTHEHVLAELEAYAPLTSQGSYCVVWDTGVEGLPEGFVVNRPWGKGNNPQTALFAYLKKLEAETVLASDGERLRLESDKMLEHKLTVTSSPEGFLRRV